MFIIILLFRMFVMRNIKALSQRGARRNIHDDNTFQLKTKERLQVYKIKMIKMRTTRDCIGLYIVRNRNILESTEVPEVNNVKRKI